MTKAEAKKDDLDKAIIALEESLKKYKDQPADKVFFRDSSIQRFEMCFELAWKTLKDFLKTKSDIECYYPNECFRAAFQSGIMSGDDPDFIEMTKDRNLMSHAYDEKSAQAVFERLPKYLLLFKQIAAAVAEK